jgi:O-antigen/teichoic acid export membrane protein
VSHSPAQAALTTQPKPADHNRDGASPSFATIVHGLSWVGGGHVVGQAFWFGSLLLLAALLSPRAFGTVAVGLIMVTAATRLMEAGTRGALIVAPRLTRNQVLGSAAWNTGTGLAFACVIGLAAGPVTRAVIPGGDAAVLRTLGLSVALYAPAVVPLALLERRLRFRRRASVQATSAIVASTAAVLAALVGAGVWALVIRQLALQGMLAVGAWLAAARLLPARDEASRRWERLRRHGAIGFLVFTLTDFVVFNADYVIVARLTSPRELGLYSLAFTLAFAPVTQFSSQLGAVLFPAAAASDAETRARRTIAGVHAGYLVLVPAIPVAIALAPVLIPAVLGARWTGMVVPFQILLVVGVAHALVNVIGDGLSGAGRIDFRARVNVVWMVGMIGALMVLVRAEGIDGAAVAHLALYAPVALVYGWVGMRLLGTTGRRLILTLRPVLALTLVQVAVTATLVVGLEHVGVSPTLSRTVASAAGVAVFASLLATVRRRRLGFVVRRASK